MTNTTTDVTDVPDHVPTELIVDLDIYHLPDVGSGFHDAWKRVQTENTNDLIWTPRNGGHWIVTKGSLINEVYADYKRFSSRNHLVPVSEYGAVDGLPVTMDPPENIPYRNLLNRGLSPQAVKRIEGRIRELAAELTGKVRPDGHCNFVSQFADVYPIVIFMALMDLPVEDTAELRELVNKITRPAAKSEALDGILGLQAYLKPIIIKRRGGSGDDLLSNMTNGKIGDRLITVDETLAMSTQVLGGGLDTVANWMSFIMLFLGQNPRHRRQLVDDPALIPRAVNEFLRRFAVATLAREVQADTIYAGVSLRKGDMLVLPTMLHGMDERANVNALEVDFLRETSEHSSFGEGGHKCPGSALGRLEVKIMLEEWLKQIPEFEVDPKIKVTFGGGIVGFMDTVPLIWQS